MQDGELDVIPFAGGKSAVGGSHDNDKGFDLSVDEAILEGLEEEAKTYFPDLSTAKSFTERVGTRAYTSDFSPFFGDSTISFSFLSVSMTTAFLPFGSGLSADKKSSKKRLRSALFFFIPSDLRSLSLLLYVSINHT